MSSFIQQLDEDPLFKDYAYRGCVGGANGRIYGIPYHANRVVEYCPSTGTTRKIGPDLGDSYYKWEGGVLGIDHCIYGCPYYWADQILKIDTSDDSASVTLIDINIPIDIAFIFI